MRNVSAKRNIPIDKLEPTRTMMDRSVLNCLVTDYEMLENSFGLPDPDDCHVLAAAVKTRADRIVTFNVRDFPKDVVEPLGSEICHPDDFLMDLFDMSQPLFIEYAGQDFQHYKAPAISFAHYVEDLRKAGVPETARRIEALKHLIDTT